MQSVQFGTFYRFPIRAGFEEEFRSKNGDKEVGHRFFQEGYADLPHSAVKAVGQDLLVITNTAPDAVVQDLGLLSYIANNLKQEGLLSQEEMLHLKDNYGEQVFRLAEETQKQNQQSSSL